MCMCNGLPVSRTIVLCCACLFQDRMHLDCVFSVLGEHVCIMLETIIGEESASRRLVDEYVRDSSGQYKLAR